jgi:hypothetical protein
MATEYPEFERRLSDSEKEVRKQAFLCAAEAADTLSVFTSNADVEVAALCLKEMFERWAGQDVWPDPAQV